MAEVSAVGRRTHNRLHQLHIPAVMVVVVVTIPVAVPLEVDGIKTVVVAAAVAVVVTVVAIRVSTKKKSYFDTGMCADAQIGMLLTVSEIKFRIDSPSFFIIK